MRIDRAWICLIGSALALLACTRERDPLKGSLIAVAPDMPVVSTEPGMVKIRLRSLDGTDAERVFATDLGAGPAAILQSRRVRLESVASLFRKPTYGDVIVVAPDDNGVLTWRGDQVEPKVEHDGGLRRVVVTWTPRRFDNFTAVSAGMLIAAKKLGGAAEVVGVPSGDDPGMVVFALPYAVTGEALLAAMAKSVDAKVELMVAGQ